MKLKPELHYSAAEVREITGMSFREILEFGPLPCWLYDAAGQRQWCGSEIIRWVDRAESRFRNQQLTLPGMDVA